MFLRVASNAPVIGYASMFSLLMPRPARISGLSASISR